MIKLIKFPLLLFLYIIACNPSGELVKLGKHFQQHNDFESLQKSMELIELGVDTSYIKKVLGDPIGMGFDYRYILDSLGPNGCTVGAVFHIDNKGKIDQKWLDEICE